MCTEQSNRKKGRGLYGIGNVRYTSPCQGCEQRYVGCHSECEKYLSSVEKKEEAKKQRIDKVKEYDDVTSVAQRRYEKYAKKNRIKLKGDNR